MIAEITRAEWMSAASILISLCAAAFTWRMMRIEARKEQRELAATQPIIQHRILRDGAPGWATVEVTVKNRYPHNLAATKIRIAAPKAGGLGVINSALNAETGETHHEVIDLAKREFVPWGEPMRAAGHSEATKTMRFALKACPKETLYSVEISFEERLAEIRRSATMLKINVPAEITSATKATMS